MFPGQKGAREAEIRIRFLGLLDSVSSIMDESTFLGFLPFTDLLKQTHKDRTLTVPGAVDKCVHFAAAQELRANQRVDSLETVSYTHLIAAWHQGLQDRRYLRARVAGIVARHPPRGMPQARLSRKRTMPPARLRRPLGHGPRMSQCAISR